MTNTTRTAAGLFAAAALSLAPASVLAENSKRWSLDLKAGAQYDDNVTVEQTDQTTGIADTSGVIEASVGYKLVKTDTSELAVGYNFSQSLHAKQSNFDLQSHSGSLSGSSKISGVTLGGSYYFYHLLLGGNDFLNMQLATPSISGFVAPNLLVRGSYNYFDKNFKTANSHDATNQRPGIDAMYFFDKSKAYISLGGNYEVESAVGPEYDYKGYAATAALKLPLPVAGRQGRLKFEYTYSRRDYDNITASISAKREEKRSTYRANAEIPIADCLSFDVEYKHVDRNSNLPIANYNQNVIDGALQFTF